MTRLLYFILLFSFFQGGISSVNNQTKNDLFKSWNIETSNSLSNQIKAVENESKISMLKNRLESFKSYIGLQDFDSINVKSIRYKFLKDFKIWGKEYFIIEANESGEKVSLITYIISFKNKSFRVFKYEYSQHVWKNVKQYSIKKFNYNKEEYSTPYGTGKNENDIIVTHVKDNKAVSSDYFLLTSMKLLKLK